MNKTYYKAGGYEFMECADCAAKPGSPILCPACYHNRTVVDKLNKLIATTRRETVEEIRVGDDEVIDCPISVCCDNCYYNAVNDRIKNYLDQLPDKQEA